jgi:hypothetical protein
MEARGLPGTSARPSSVRRLGQGPLSGSLTTQRREQSSEHGPRRTTRTTLSWPLPNTPHTARSSRRSTGTTQRRARPVALEPVLASRIQRHAGQLVRSQRQSAPRTLRCTRRRTQRLGPTTRAQKAERSGARTPSSTIATTRMQPRPEERRCGRTTRRIQRHARGRRLLRERLPHAGQVSQQVTSEAPTRRDDHGASLS